MLVSDWENFLSSSFLSDLFDEDVLSLYNYALPLNELLLEADFDSINKDK